MLCVLLSAILTGAIVHYSLRHGRLSRIPELDDIGYMCDGLKRLQVLYDARVPGFFRYYESRPPHSPFSDLLAMAAFAVFGIHDWAPYAANSLLIFAFFLSASALLRGLKLWQKAVCFVFLSTIPFVGMMVHEFRPDGFCSLMTAMGMLVLLTRPLLGSSWKHQVAAGLLFGAALLAKPPSSPATLVCLGASLALATLGDWITLRIRPDWKRAARAWGVTIVTCVVIALPHYLIDGRDIVGYIYDTLFGAHKSVWETRIPLADHLRYFITGPGGQIMLGGHLALLLGVMGLSIGGLLLFRRRREIVRIGLLLAAVLLTYAIPTAVHHKQEFFGLTFDMMLALVAVFLIGRLLARERLVARRVSIGSAILIVAMLLGIWRFQWPARAGAFNDDNAVNFQRIAGGIYHDVFAHIQPPPYGGVTPDSLAPMGQNVISVRPQVILTGVGYINSQLLSYWSLRDLRPADWVFPADTDDPAVFHRAFDDADFVVAAEPGTGLFADFLLSYRIQDRLLADLRARKDFKQIGQYRFPRTGRSLYLFQRVDYFGWKPISGIGDYEGPFEGYPGHVFRWGYGPMSKLKVNAPADGNYELTWRARNRLYGQTVTVKVDGKLLADVPMAASEEFVFHRFPLTLSAGEHEIEFDYKLWQLPRPTAVLFQQLRFDPG